MATISKSMPKKTSQGTTGKKQKTSDLYLKDGIPCGDMGDDTYDAANIGKGNSVGADASFGIHNSFANGIPNIGMEGITAEVLTPAHKSNVDKKVLNTKEDSTWGGVISPTDMSANNKFGV